MVPSFNDRSSSVTKSNTAAQIKFPKHEPCKWSFQHDSHSDVGDSAGFINFVIESVSRTRLHSSRMRTARLLPVSTSMHYGGCLGVPASGLGVPPSGLEQGVCIQAWNGADPPLWTEWRTGAKIYPCPKLRLREVKIIKNLSLYLHKCTFTMHRPKKRCNFRI